MQPRAMKLRSSRNLLDRLVLTGAVVRIDTAGANYVLAVKRNGGRTGTVLGGPGLCEWVADPDARPGLRSLIPVRTERIGPCGRRRRAEGYSIS